MDITTFWGLAGLCTCCMALVVLVPAFLLFLKDSKLAGCIIFLLALLFLCCSSTSFVISFFGY